MLHQSSLLPLVKKSRLSALEKRLDLYVLMEGLSELVLENLNEAFAEAGYTMDDLKYDSEQNQFEHKDDKVNFVIPLVYQLDGDSLLCHIAYKRNQIP